MRPVAPRTGARGLKRHHAQRTRSACRRAPHGARGLKLEQEYEQAKADSRALHGARGLKLLHRLHHRHRLQSRPARGAWIETEKLGGRIVKSSATFPYRMLFSLGIEQTTALCQNWVREWQCREECSNGKLGSVRGNRGISYGELIAGRCLHEFGGERYY